MSSQRRIVYDTPGRECKHADDGCCPGCFDPFRMLRHTGGVWQIDGPILRYSLDPAPRRQ
jgi:hypothetical protein